jgi:adenylate kinase
VDEKKRLALEELANGRIEALEKHCSELHKKEKMYMRQFLMKAIIPVLTEGMIDVWRVGPTDPVDYLAEYIFKKSNELAK